MKSIKSKIILFSLIGLFLFTSCQKNDSDDELANSSIKMIKEITIDLGTKMKLEAAVSPSDLDIQELGWLSYNPDFVSIDSEGNIEALRSGTATIKVYLLDNPMVFTRCNIIVSPDKFLGEWKTTGELELTIKNFEGHDEITYPIQEFIKLCNDTVALTTNAEVRSLYADMARFSMWNNSIFEKDYSFTVGEGTDIDMKIERGVYHVDVSDSAWYRSIEHSGYVVNYVEHHTDSFLVARETLVTLSEDNKSAVMRVYPFEEGIDIKVKLTKVEE